MKESYRKGLANHPGPESCEGSANTKAALEALTGVYGTYASVCRLCIELRNRLFQGADEVRQLGRQHRGRRYSEPAEDPAESQTRACIRHVRKHRTFMCENREALLLPEPPQGGGPVGEGDEP